MFVGSNILDKIKLWELRSCELFCNTFRIFLFLAVVFSLSLVFGRESNAFSGKLEDRTKRLYVVSGEYNFSALYNDYISFYVVNETFLLASRDDLVDMERLTIVQEKKRIDLTNILQITMRERVENKRVQEEPLVRVEDQRVNDSNCTDKFRVYFPLGKHTLSKDQKLKLEEFLNKLGERDPLYKDREYEVLGWGCALGGPGINKRLSEMRAKEVYSFLKSKGIKNIKAEGRGISKESEVLCLNRRADILVKGVPCKEDR